MEVQIPNPVPKPPERFPVLNFKERERCVPAADFPANCTVVLKEGEPRDYIAGRGLVSVMGILRKFQPNIVSNLAVFNNVHRAKLLHVEFIDESFNSYRVPVADPEAEPPVVSVDMFAKIDLKVKVLHPL